jgi:hypothetical protein
MTELVYIYFFFLILRTPNMSSVYARLNTTDLVNIIVFWYMVLHSTLVDKLSHASISSDQIFQIFSSIPEHVTEHHDTFWDGQLFYFMF